MPKVMADSTVSVVKSAIPDGAATEATLKQVVAAVQGIAGVSSGGSASGSSRVTVDGGSVSAAVSGTVAVSSLPALPAGTNVIGHVVVDSIPAGSSGLTNAELRASPVPVSGAFYPATQPVSGTVAVSNLPSSQAVTGPLTDTQLRATAVPVSLATAPTTPVTGTFWQTTQPVSAAALPLPSGAATETTLAAVKALLPAALDAGGGLKVREQGTVTVTGTVTASGPLTDTQLRAASVPVSAASLPLPSGAAQEHTTAISPHAMRLTDGTAFYKPTTPSDTQPVSGTITANQGTAGAAAWKVDGSAVTQPVSGTVTSNQGGTWTAGLSTQAAASSAPVGSVSLGNSTGKTLVMKTGTLATTAATADQVILTYTVTTGKTFYLCYLDFTARLTTFAATATLFGTLSLESPAGTKLYTVDVFHVGSMDGRVILLPEPIPVAAGAVIRVVCTPSGTTAMTWKANFGGYEK